MSASQLAEAGEELQLTAFTTLSRLIKAETNPDRIEKLLALALRASTARQPAKSPASPPPTSPTTPAPHPNRTSPGDVSEPERSTPTVKRPSLASLPPAFTLMSDAEYLALEKQIGTVEAHRRRLIRAHLASLPPKDDADSS